MRIETRAALPHRFVHRGATYRTPGELLSIALPIIEQALRRNAPVALIASAPTERRVREAMGSDGPTASLICLPAPETGLRRSGQSVAVRRARELRELTDRAGPVTVLAEHDPRQSLLEAAAWVEAEAAMNLAASGLRVTMTCLYREPIDAALATAVSWVHPQLLDTDGCVRDNSEQRPLAEVLERHPVPALPWLGPPDRELVFTPWQLTDVRVAVAEAARGAGLDPERVEDFVLAVNEVAGNAVEHGYGPGLWQAWSRDRTVICEVHDGGALAQPFPGLCLPHPAQPRGRGMWVARQLCDLLHVWSDRDGTHVRIQSACD